MSATPGSGASDRPGDESPDHGWLPGRLHEKLFQRRIVLVTGRLDDALAARASAEMLTLDAIAEAPIDVYLDSRDGSLEAAFVVIDMIDVIRAPVRIHCRGQVGGPPIGVLAAGDQRSAFPHARFWLAQPTVQFVGTPGQLAAHSERHTDLLWRLCARLARITGRAAEEIAQDVRRGRCLDAQEALDYGLIQAIETGKAGA